MTFRVSTLVTTLVILTLSLILFRPALISQFGPVGQLAAALPVITFFALIRYISIDRNNLLLLVAPLYFIAVGSFHAALIYNGNFLPVLSGLYSLALPSLFWISFANSPYLNMQKVNTTLIYIATLNALGAVVFFFYDPLVFGWVDESIYSNEALMARGNVELRARTFIGGPQTVGVYASIMLLAAYFDGSIASRLKIVSCCLIFLMGALSGSKSFYLGLAVTGLTLMLLQGVRLRLALFFVVFCTFVVLLYDQAGIFSRVIGIFTYIHTGIEEHATFIAWNEVVQFLFNSSLLNLTFGNGIGALSRAGMNFYESDLPFTTAESFLLQVIFEAGLLGGLVVLGLFFFLLIQKFKKREYPEFAICLGILINMIITPSFYGAAFSFLGYFYLLSSYAKRSVRA